MTNAPDLEAEGVAVNEMNVPGGHGQATATRRQIPVELVDPDPDQPRHRFDPAALAELAASMQANGLAVPILVRPVAGRYRIVHGERRWRAASSLGWTEIPAEVRDVDEDTVRWWQLAENLNRADLSPVEEARAYRRLLDAGVSRDTLAGRIGKSPSYIAHKLRLLELPAPLALLLDAGALTEGHIRQLLRIRSLYTPEHTVAAVTGGPMPVGIGPMWDDTTTESARAAVAWPLLVSLRPEDFPAGHPVNPDGHPLVADAVEALCREATDGAFPFWPLPATWFAAAAVVYRLSVAQLDKAIDHWIERLHSAIVAVDSTVSRDTVPAPDTTAWFEWWGHRADLRHAGLLAEHHHLLGAALTTLETTSSLVWPSSSQSWGPNHDACCRAAAAEEVAR